MALTKDTFKAATSGAISRFDSALDTAADLVHDVATSAPARDVTARVRRGAGRSITAAKKGVAEVRRRARLLEEEAAAATARRVSDGA
ncbi:hypothetical protein [Curtobacterium sp. MCSS17_016]|uniref:hypothetical protein n=1 Tax=Curtobacterium sp. MCSS17_016 TaxID=2175644 RepID=UPI000DA74115|nr:hypothetical protein [Curtobacterium sp. MCSS17_016]WIE80985.1 hypothetical protein DEJ19_020930 [Curtobacterium sp. MCSS17_016]